MRRGALILFTTAFIAGWPALARPPLVVIDPGHGGAQEGADGPGGLKEKDLALQIARKLRLHLEELVGARIVMTRDSDIDLPLADRVALANRHRPDLFISVHANSMPTRHLRSRINGIETFFLSASASGAEAASTADRENADGPEQPQSRGSDTLSFILADLARAEAHADSSRLAYAIHQRIIQATRAEDHGVQQAPFYVLNGLAAPAVLVEVGYISHPAEGKRLRDSAYQDRLARGIAEGVRDFIAQTRARTRSAVATPGQ